MSPSLNSLARVLWPETAVSWGLVFGVQEIVACRIVRADGSWQVVEMATEASPVSLYKGMPAPDLAGQLAPLIAKVAAGAAGRYTPVCVAIPDPAAGLNVLELESMPPSAAEREALARWHLEKLWPSGTALTCRIQELGMADGKPLLLVSATPSAWLEGLNTACRQANVVPTLWQPAMAHRFNRYHDQLLRAERDGALLAIDARSWTLMLWDAHGKARHVRSRWLEASDTRSAETIAVETERAVRAYVHGGRGRRLDAVHLLGDGAVAQRAKALLEARMQNACVQLSSLTGIDIAAGVSVSHPEAALAVTAAMGSGA